MKKILFAAVLLAGCLVRAEAYTEVIEVVGSTAVVRGVTCSTGTAIRIDYLADSASILSGYRRAGIRIENQDSTYSAYVGFDADVSSQTASAYLGEQIKPGVSAPYSLGKDIKFYCLAANGAGASGIRLSIVFLGYK